MTGNELLARWQGWKMEGYGWVIPNYLYDDAACKSLLDTLVEKGYKAYIVYSLEGKRVNILDSNDDFVVGSTKEHQTLNEAIIAACLEVARKDMGNVES